MRAANNARAYLIAPFVILREAKDLTAVASGDEVLRFAQDDWGP